MAAGADVTLRGGREKISVAHVAAVRGYVDIMRAVIERGANVHGVTTGHETTLHAAASNGRKRFICSWNLGPALQHGMVSAALLFHDAARTAYLGAVLAS